MNVWFFFLKPWRRLKLTGKFTLAFGLLLLLLGLTVITSLVVLTTVRHQAEAAISTGLQVSPLLLENEETSPQAGLLENELKNAQAQIDRTGRLGNTLLIALFILAIGLTAWLVLGLHTTVTRNLRSLTLVMTQLHRGRLDSPVQLQTTDEVGQLAGSMNILAGQINLLVNQLESKAALAQAEKQRSDSLLNVVIPIGVALSAEQNFDRLLEKILLEAKGFCNADAGTLYLRTEKDELNFVILTNDTLKIKMGGTSGIEIDFPPIPLYDKVTGQPNHNNVAAYVALTGESINIPDAYKAEGFNFSGTKAFDARTAYHSVSFLTTPLKNVHNHVVGVLQLINARAPRSGQIIPFDPSLEQIATSLSSLATVALEAYIREQSLRQQIRQLRIEIDEAKRQQQVDEIVETDFFQDLQLKAHQIRRRTRRGKSERLTDKNKS
jgi:GAF domain-containing protein